MATALDGVITPLPLLASLGVWGYRGTPFPALGPLVLHLFTTAAVAGLAAAHRASSSSSGGGGRGGSGGGGVFLPRELIAAAAAAATASAGAAADVDRAADAVTGNATAGATSGQAQGPDNRGASATESHTGTSTHRDDSSSWPHISGGPAIAAVAEQSQALVMPRREGVQGDGGFLASTPAAAEHPGVAAASFVGGSLREAAVAGRELLDMVSMRPRRAGTGAEDREACDTKITCAAVGVTLQQRMGRCACGCCSQWRSMNLGWHSSGQCWH